MTATPTSRMAAAFLFCVPTALVGSLAAALLALAAAAAAALRLPRRDLLRRLLVLNTFAAMLWLVLPFSTPGDTLFTLGPLTASAAGVRLAGLITLKANALGLAFAGLTADLGPQGVARGLTGLGMPAALAQVVLFTQRYAAVLAEEYARLATAARARGFTPSTNLHTYRTYASLVGMVLVRAVERSERVLEAMRCRGFTGSFPTLGPAKPGAGDALLLAGAALVATAVLAVDLYPTAAL